MLTPGTTSLPPPQLGVLSPYGEAELNRLISQRRVFNRLDWWSPYEWLHSDAFCVLGTGEGVDAALLAVPVSFGEINALHSTQSSMAWLRWCAVADGVSASRVLYSLLAYNAEKLAQAGIDQTFCIVETIHWLSSYLRDAGYTRVDDVITMIYRYPTMEDQGRQRPLGIHIRLAQVTDIDELCEVDASAFEEQWRYPPFVLRRALASSSYFTVAQWRGHVIGYQFATCYEDDAHITRLAVRPDFQGQGVGADLLSDVLSYIRSDARVRVVTLNTQASNQVSQRLYTRLGFEELRPSLRVMRKNNTR